MFRSLTASAPGVLMLVRRESIPTINPKMAGRSERLTCLELSREARLLREREDRQSTTGSSSVHLGIQHLR